MVANNFGNKSCMQPMKGSTCTNEGFGFFLFGEVGRAGGGNFFLLFFGGVAMLLCLGQKW